MAFSHNPKISTSGLRLYIDPADLNSHGSGTELNDLSGNGWTDNIADSPEITFTGNPTHISDTGAGGYFYYTNSSYTDWATTDFSISAWGNRDNYTSDAQGRFCDLLYAGNGHLRLTLKGAPTLLFRPTGGGGNTLISGGSTTAGNWYNICVTRISGRQQIFINGEFITQSSHTYSTTYYNQEVWVGRSNFGSGYTNGKIPLIKFYNRELTESEINQNYNALSSRFP